MDTINCHRIEQLNNRPVLLQLSRLLLLVLLLSLLLLLLLLPLWQPFFHLFSYAQLTFVVAVVAFVVLFQANSLSCCYYCFRIFLLVHHYHWCCCFFQYSNLFSLLILFHTSFQSAAIACQVELFVVTVAIVASDYYFYGVWPLCGILISLILLLLYKKAKIVYLISLICYCY